MAGDVPRATRYSSPQPTAENGLVPETWTALVQLLFAVDELPFKLAGVRDQAAQLRPPAAAAISQVSRVPEADRPALDVLPPLIRPAALSLFLALEWARAAAELVELWPSTMRQLAKQQPLSWAALSRLAELAQRVGAANEGRLANDHWSVVAEWTAARLHVFSPVFLDSVDVAFLLLWMPPTEALLADKRATLLAAALVRDVGILTLQDHLLQRSQPLPQVSARIREIHPRVGAALLGTVAHAPFELCWIVAEHHTRQLVQPENRLSTMLPASRWLATATRAIELRNAHPDESANETMTRLSAEVRQGWWDAAAVKHLAATLERLPSRRRLDTVGANAPAAAQPPALTSAAAAAFGDETGTALARSLHSAERQLAGLHESAAASSYNTIRSFAPAGGQPKMTAGGQPMVAAGGQPAQAGNYNDSPDTESGP